MRPTRLIVPPCGILFAISVLVVFATAPPRAASVQQQPAGSRSIVVLGDLPMGVGRTEAGEWHPYEDFRWGAELAAFLEAMSADGQHAVDLVLNGDTFELLQSAQSDCSYADADLGCTESEALRRLERVLAAHNAEITALGRLRPPVRIGSC